MRVPLSRTSIWLLLAGVFAIAADARAEVVDFDDLSLDAESAWRGPVPLGAESPDPWGGTLRTGTFRSGQVEFVNRHNLDYGSWSGFAYSNRTNTTTPGFGSLLSAYAGSGFDPGDDNYGVGYGYLDELDPSDVDQLQQLPYLELPEGASVQSARVTNTTYAALSMLRGDSFAKQFGGPDGYEKDWFKLTVYGTDALSDPLPASVEFFLADFRSNDNQQDYIVDDWATVDLSPLADARRLYFNLTSSDSGDNGMNTPSCFAIDQIAFTAAPEPSSLAMFAAAGVAAAAASLVRRRRRAMIRGNRRML